MRIKVDWGQFLGPPVCGNSHLWVDLPAITRSRFPGRPQDRINMRIQILVPRPSKRGIPEISFFRILMLMWSVRVFSYLRFGRKLGAAIADAASRRRSALCGALGRDHGRR